MQRSMLSSSSLIVLVIASALSLSTCRHHGKNPHRFVKSHEAAVCQEGDRYRRQDGQCNNLLFPTYGSAGTTFQRLLEADYSDGVSKPRSHGVDGSSLPSPREISVKCHSPRNATSDVTLMLMQWGQFLDHDISLTSRPVADQAETDCCTSTHPECFNINLVNDSYFSCRDCMPFKRSAREKSPGKTKEEQINLLTSFIDASNVYGSSEEETEALRGLNGELKTTVIGEKSYLPQNGNILNKPDKCRAKTEREEYCFLAGETARVNEQPGLGAMHTIWMREHNRIARQLRGQHPVWGDERVFQETRRIVGAMMQVITYNEFLPLVLGAPYINASLTESTDDIYNAYAQPDIFNSFATAAYRFGHSLVPEEITMDAQVLKFKNVFFSPTQVLENMDHLTKGLSNGQPMAADRHFSHSVTRHLFQRGEKDGFDLVSLNIQRGRDHGLPSYTAFRNVAGEEPTTLSQLFPDDPECQSVYRHIDDVDLYTGGMAETPVVGGLVGPTFAHIIGLQFELLKTGDRFFYLNTNASHAFNQKQIKALNTVRLSKVICDNTENTRIQRNVFKPVDRNLNPEEDCNEIPGLDLEHFFEV